MYQAPLISNPYRDKDPFSFKRNQEYEFKLSQRDYSPELARVLKR